MMALVELLGLIAFAVTARLKVLSKRIALPKDQAAARLAAFDLRAQLNGIAAFKRKDAARMRGERRELAKKARIDAADRRKARLAKRIIARDRRAARAAASRAGRRASVEDARRARIEEKAEALVKRETDFLEGVVLPAGLRERLVRLATATRNAKQNRSPFRHMLLHGPPGTGKTLCAKRLAKATGLEYALMSGD